MGRKGWIARYNIGDELLVLSNSCHQFVRLERLDAPSYLTQP
jgi:hypothetical protein